MHSRCRITVSAGSCMVQSLPSSAQWSKLACAILRIRRPCSPEHKQGNSALRCSNHLWQHEISVSMIPRNQARKFELHDWTWLTQGRAVPLPISGTAGPGLNSLWNCHFSKVFLSDPPYIHHAPKKDGNCVSCKKFLRTHAVTLQKFVTRRMDRNGVNQGEAGLT